MAVNQQIAPAGVVDASGHSWLPLGTVTITGSSLKVMLSNLANGRVEADAVMIVPTTANSTPLPTPQPQPQSPTPIVIDNDTTGYSQTPIGAWALWNGQGYDNNIEEAQPGDGSAQATWNFTGLTPGNYQVNVTYSTYSNRATNAPYTIYDGTTPLGTVAVNQQIAPAGVVDASGSSWLPLGTVTITGSSLKVMLSNLANGRVEADAVMIVPTTANSTPLPTPQPQPQSPTPIVIDNDTTGYSQTPIGAGRSGTDRATTTTSKKPNPATDRPRPPGTSPA